MDNKFTVTLFDLNFDDLAEAEGFTLYINGQPVVPYQKKGASFLRQTFRHVNEHYSDEIQRINWEHVSRIRFNTASNQIEADIPRTGVSNPENGRIIKNIFQALADALHNNHADARDAFLKSCSIEFVKSSKPKTETVNKEGVSSMSSNVLIDEVLAMLLAHKQVILTGAPGTGKTFLAQAIAAKLLSSDQEKIEAAALLEKGHEQYEFVQFHPSYDYTDFVEGLRPYKPPGHKEIGFRLENGIFKRLCEKASRETGVNVKKYIIIIDEINRADLSKVFGELMYGLEADYRGKYFSTQYTALWQSMYEENEKALGAGNSENQGKSKDGKFMIPSNVYIIGTMNDIDRSVEAFDFALRRRFVWKEIEANRVMDDTVKEMLKKAQNDVSNGLSSSEITSLIGSAVHLNEAITAQGKKFGLNQHYHLGPAYFGKTKMNSLEKAKCDIWCNRIEFILREYVRGYDKDSVDEFIHQCMQAFGVTEQQVQSFKGPKQ